MKQETLEEIAKRQLAKYGFEKEAHMVALTVQELRNACNSFEQAGFVVVPKEPTEEMVKVGADAGMYPRAVYRAMLSALTEETGR